MTLRNEISKQWRLWIKSNLKKGVSKDYIFNMLLENGFSYEAVRKEMNYETDIKSVIPEKWKAWLQENISMGQDKDGLFKVLMMNGFAYDSIREEMQYQPSVPLEDLKDPFSHTNQKYDKSNNLHQSVSLLSESAIEVVTDKLKIFYVQSFLSETECDYLITLIRKQLRPSELLSPEGDQFFRTSSTCDLARFNDKTIQDIDARICDLVGIESEYSEPIQGQFYEVGQEFKPHTDFFEGAELNENEGPFGQRSFTVMIYLNSVESGGETTFPKINKEFTPEKGKAVIWSNLNFDLSPNHFSLHHAKKVQLGYKAIITKWFRTGFL